MKRIWQRLLEVLLGIGMMFLLASLYSRFDFELTILTFAWLLSFAVGLRWLLGEPHYHDEDFFEG